MILAAIIIPGLCACGARKEIIAPPVETQVSTPKPTPEPTPEPIIGEVLADEDGDGIIN